MNPPAPVTRQRPTFLFSGPRPESFTPLHRTQRSSRFALNPGACVEYPGAMEIKGARQRGTPGPSLVWVGLLGLLASFWGLGAGVVHAHPAPFTRALTDDVLFNPGYQKWLPRTLATGAKLVLLEIDWAGVEPDPPPTGANPTNPANPNFNFRYVDAIVHEFQGTGIAPAFLVTDAPRWAETPGGPGDLEARGAWRPNPAAFGQLAATLARRYSGSYPDPENPKHKLPRVRYFQAWAEANFSIHLAPQWVRSGGVWVPTSPGLYRQLLNSFYAGIKSVRRDDVV